MPTVYEAIHEGLMEWRAARLTEGDQEADLFTDDEAKIIADACGGMQDRSPAELFAPEGVSPGFLFACWLAAGGLHQEDGPIINHPMRHACATAMIAMRAFPRIRALREPPSE